MGYDSLLKEMETAEKRVEALLPTDLEKKITRYYTVFVVLCVAIFLIKTLLMLVGVSDTGANPWLIGICGFFIFFFGCILLTRHLARQQAKALLEKAQFNLFQFRNVKPPLGATTGSSGGWSLYKKNSTVLTQAMAQQENKDIANQQAADQKATAEATAKDNKTSPLKTSMKRGGSM